MNTTAPESNREKALALHAEGIGARQIAEKLGLSRVTVYKYLEALRPAAQTERTGAVSKIAEPFEVELLKIELESTRKQLELYKRECTRLRDIVGDEV